MRPAPLLTAVAVFAATACQNNSEAAPPAMDTSGRSANTHRGGDVAIREEFDAARRAASIGAWDLFLARHPEHPLAAEARGERERLAGRAQAD